MKTWLVPSRRKIHPFCGSTRFSRHLIQGLIAAICFTSLAAVQAAPKDELKDLHKRIKTLQKEVESAEGKKSDVTDALKQSERAISTANRRLRELSQQQAEVNTSLNRTQQEARSTQSRIAEQQTLLGKLLKQQYVAGQEDALKLLLNQQDPNEVARQLHYYTYLSRSRAGLIDDLRQNLQHAHALAQTYQQKSTELGQIKAEQGSQKQQLEREHSTRKSVLKSIEKQIVARRHEIGRLQQDEKRLTRLVEKLARIAPPPKRKKGKAPRQEAVLRNDKLPSPDHSDSPFQALKGRLRLPLRGELIGRFGSLREDSGATWKGLFIKAATGQEVRAVASGRVVFSDWLRGFGNMVIVDHGDGYMSLYGNNETLYKQAGENVQAGDAIAAAGNSGGNPQTGLYFEMRYQSRPFDPMGWVRLN